MGFIKSVQKYNNLNTKNKNSLKKFKNVSIHNNQTSNA